eukprot:TRINITY_DN17444_c0_g1_i1.p1 TRINITY_DN17444_c0_g1~~TRINITY_DN17444_c0_g1_i1.p1  ORF type:complete len:164 (+),score=5.11 TRINITY_DN17444_c0_g1_i1:28-492(+)
MEVLTCRDILTCIAGYLDGSELAALELSCEDVRRGMVEGGVWVKAAGGHDAMVGLKGTTKHWKVRCWYKMGLEECLCPMPVFSAQMNPLEIWHVSQSKLRVKFVVIARDAFMRLLQNVPPPPPRAPSPHAPLCMMKPLRSRLPKPHPPVPPGHI